MDFEEIEANYTKECDVAKEQFLAGIQQKKDLPTLESRYTDALKKNRKRYYSLYEQQLRYSKSKHAKKRDFIPNLGTKPFLVQPARMSLTAGEQHKFNRDMARFQRHLRWRHFFERTVPSWMLAFYYGVRVRLEALFRDISIVFLVIKRSITKFIVKLSKRIAASAKHFCSIFVRVIMWILHHILSLLHIGKKKSDAKEAPKEGAPPAEGSAPAAA